MFLIIILNHAIRGVNTFRGVFIKNTYRVVLSIQVMTVKFNETLKKLRREKNLSQKELGNKLGLAESTIGMYEQGKRQPDYETLLKIADFFEVTLDFLLGNPKDASSVKEKEAAYRISDPDLQIAFKDASDFSEEARRQAIDFIKYLKEKEKAKGRKG
ncbi:helix-turn-helix transcriptional regulator [Bacillus subtilis]|uniref:helix-turn-helix domain-containing protein n=2 Tax=Bacillus subtilis TaxID=1423 RepID=UPI002DB6C230|nr:helix-turn-helix transcriptional regulator [Bacillus subtilis]MEC0502150.1 helix-turn-helix transcriptional regulator [Bacillus subtilis]